MTRSLHRIDGHTVAAEVHLPDDTRPPVVFLHGIMASLDLVTEVLADPAAESWISLSLPGHAPGRFPARSAMGAIDADLFGHLVEATLAALLGSRQVIATGWSTGGFAALNLCIRHPHRVAAVATLAGFASGNRLGGAVGWLDWFAGRPIGRRAVVAGMRLAARSPAFYRMAAGLMAADRMAAAAVPAPLTARMHAGFAAHDPESLAAVLAALPSLDISDRLGAVTVPAWVAGGGRDPVVPLAETERLARDLPSATLRVYPSAGHLFFSEWPTLREDFAAWRESLPVAPSR